MRRLFAVTALTLTTRFTGLNECLDSTVWLVTDSRLCCFHFCLLSRGASQDNVSSWTASTGLCLCDSALSHEVVVSGAGSGQTVRNSFWTLELNDGEQQKVNIKIFCRVAWKSNRSLSDQSQSSTPEAGTRDCSGLSRLMVREAPKQCWETSWDFRWVNLHLTQCRVWFSVTFSSVYRERRRERAREIICFHGAIGLEII